MRCRLFVVVLSALFLGLRLSAAPAAAPIPLEDFFKDPTFDQLRISPDGQKLAALAKWKDHLNLFMIDMKTKQPKLLTGLTDQEITAVRWVGSNRLIFDTKEDGYLSGGFFAIDADGSHPKVLRESVHQQGNSGHNVYRYLDFLDYYGDSDKEVLATTNDRSEHEPDVAVVNVRTGAKRIVATNPGNVSVWVADHTGAVRAGFGERGREQFLIYRDSDRGEFKELKHWDHRDGGIVPLAFDAGNRYLYVRSNIGRDTDAICLYDPSTGEVKDTLFEDPVYDADDVILSRVDNRLLGFTCEREHYDYIWTDKTMQTLQTLLDREFPDTRNVLYSRSRDDGWILVLTGSDRDLGTFYLLDTRKPLLEKLVARADWLPPARLAEMRPIEYKSRDGLTIHGYLTLPAGRDPHGLPLIVNPHGGPWVRDEWGFNPEVQFLASRGYAVLQMNFRGSTGYGRHFLEAGYKQWGLKMQDDITDGVHWAVDQGIADAKRVGIYGASYGGYATMAGLAFTPDLYRCGINYVGVTDIELLLSTIPTAWESTRAALEDMTGNAKTDKERLEATSPMDHADQIKVPVFFAYGELDDRVSLKHATRTISQLKKRGIPVEVMVRSDEGHGYYRWKNKIELYHAFEDFLKKYLPADPAPAQAAASGEAKPKAK